MGTIVVLDTNLFIEGSISITPSAPTSISSYRKKLNLKIFIPEGVRDEVVQKNIEKFAKSVNDVEKAVASYRNEVDSELKVELKKADSFRKQFESSFGAYLKDNRIQILKFPEALPSHSELFQMAVQKKPPFNEKGNNYRDALMALSLKKFCSEHQRDKVMFVTKDKEFVRLLVELKITNLKVYDDGSAQNELESRLDKKLQKQIEEMKVHIREFINENQLDELKDYCARNTRFDIDKLGGLGDEIVAIKGISDLTIKAVEDFELTDDERKPFLVSLVALGTLSVDAETSLASKNAFKQVLHGLAKKPRKVGDTKGQGASVWDELHRQQTGYYDKFIEARDIGILLDIKAEVESSTKTGKQKVNFLAVTHSVRNILKYAALD